MVCIANASIAVSTSVIFSKGLKQTHRSNPLSSGSGFSLNYKPKTIYIPFERGETHYEKQTR